MAEVLGEFRSKSTRGKIYQVKRGGDGVIYCDCWQWKKTRMCSHIQTVQNNIAQKTYIAQPETRKKSIQEAIDNAVASMKGA